MLSVAARFWVQWLALRDRTDAFRTRADAQVMITVRINDNPIQACCTAFLAQDLVRSRIAKIKMGRKFQTFAAELGQQAILVFIYFSFGSRGLWKKKRLVLLIIFFDLFIVSEQV